MKKCSGFSAALLVVFLAPMLWAQERAGQPRSQPHGGAPQRAWDMSRELEAGTFHNAALPPQGLRLAPKQASHPAGRAAANLPGRAGTSTRASRARGKRSLDRARYREGTMFTITSIIPGSMDVSPEPSDRNISGGCMAAAASASTSADSFFRLRPTITMPATTGCGTATTS